MRYAKTLVNRALCALLLVMLLVPAAFAGKYKLVYESKGIVSVELDEDSRGMSIFFRVLPLTGDFNPGPCVIRLNGIAVWETNGDTYEGYIRIPENGSIPALQKLQTPGMGQPNARDIRVTSGWFKGLHQIEAYFVATDGKGKQNKDRSAAPATQFRFERVEEPAAASTGKGEAMTADQLEAAIKDAFKQGADDAQSAWEKERAELLRQIQQLTDDLNLARANKPVPFSSTGLPKTILLRRYIPVKWTEGPLPAVGDVLEFKRGGKKIASVKVVEVYAQAARIWVVGDIPIDLPIDGDGRFTRGK